MLLKALAFGYFLCWLDELVTAPHKFILELFPAEIARCTIEVRLAHTSDLGQSKANGLKGPNRAGSAGKAL